MAKYIAFKNKTVFANTSAGVFTVNFNEINSTYHFYVYNLQGEMIREIKSITKKEVILDISRQPKGIYLIKICPGECLLYLYIRKL
jgi:type IX secretion system substrate protein